ADLLVAHPSQWILRKLAHILPAAEKVSRCRPVQTADEVHQRRHARTRRPYDRDEIAFGDVEVDAPQRFDGHFAQVVHLGEPDRLEDHRPNNALPAGPGPLTPPAPPPGPAPRCSDSKSIKLLMTIRSPSWRPERIST